MKGLHKDSIQDVGNPHQWMIDDARMELIQQIKAEVERRKEEAIKNTKNHNFDEVFYSGKSVALGSLLSFLSDLEKEEKSTPQEQLVKTNILEDLKHYLATTPKEQIEKNWESLKEWSKVGPSVSEFLGWKQPICEELEKAVVDYFEGYWPGMETAEQCNTDLHFTPPAIMRLARHFAEWGAEQEREQMLKGAVEGVVCGDNAKLWICNNPPSFVLDKFDDGDKVKLIFIKEN